MIAFNFMFLSFFFVNPDSRKFFLLNFRESEREEDEGGGERERKKESMWLAQLM